MSNNSKRARVLKKEEDGAKQQEAAASLAPPTAAPAVAETKGASSSNNNKNTHPNQVVELLSPVTWEEEIPQLIYVKMQTDDPKVVATALADLGNLMVKENCQHMQNTYLAYNLGAHPIIIQNLQKYQYNEQVQRTGCRCLQRLAVLHRSTIVTAGAIEAVVNALKIFPNNLHIQWSGIGTITNLFLRLGCDDIFQKASKRFVYDLDGLDLTVSAMKRFPNDASLVAYCCGLFACLAQNKKFHKPMRIAGVLGCVGIACDKFFEDDTSVKKCASCFMKFMIDR